MALCVIYVRLKDGKFSFEGDGENLKNAGGDLTIPKGTTTIIWVAMDFQFTSFSGPTGTAFTGFQWNADAAVVTDLNDGKQQSPYSFMFSGSTEAGGGIVTMTGDPKVYNEADTPPLATKTLKPAKEASSEPAMGKAKRS